MLGEVKGQKGLNNNDKVPNAISNENFCFANEILNKTESKQSTEVDEKRLQSPVESHFALTPVTSSEASSPANGFSGHVCTDLLQEELDQLENSMKIKDINVVDTKEHKLENSFSIETLTTPSEEHINMFSRHLENENLAKLDKGGDGSNTKHSESGEVRFKVF